jgi:hypothetical protein
MPSHEPVSVLGGKNSTDIQGLEDFARMESMIFSDTLFDSCSSSTIFTDAIISDQRLLDTTLRHQWFEDTFSILLTP